MNLQHIIVLTSIIFSPLVHQISKAEIVADGGIYKGVGSFLPEHSISSYMQVVLANERSDQPITLVSYNA